VAGSNPQANLTKYLSVASEHDGEVQFTESFLASYALELTKS